jgi:LuxR family maltose regulon positive regulatory protein
LLVPATLLLARVLHASGEFTPALQLLDALLAPTQRRRPWQQRETRLAQARLALARGDLAAVQHWASTYARHSDDVPLLQQEQEALLMARMLIMQGQAGAALALLERWQADARAKGRTSSVIEILALIALAHCAQSALAQAAQTLTEALALAQSQGFTRLFLDEGSALANVLLLLRQQAGGPVPYLDSLLAAFSSAEDRGSRTESFGRRLAVLSPQSSVYVEPLSPQEQRVLQLLAAGLSNPEIAQELIVSVNTVKTQVQSIYRKLNVTSRSQARQAAQSLRRAS